MIVEFAAGKNYLCQPREFRPLLAEVLVPCCLPGRVMAWCRKSPSRLQHALHGAVIFRVVVDADVLLSCRSLRPCRTRLPRRRIILQLDRDLVLQAEPLDLLLGVGDLLLRQRHAIGGHAVVLRRVAWTTRPSRSRCRAPLARLAAAACGRSSPACPAASVDVVIPVGASRRRCRPSPCRARARRTHSTLVMVGDVFTVLVRTPPSLCSCALVQRPGPPRDTRRNLQPVLQRQPFVERRAELPVRLRVGNGATSNGAVAMSIRLRGPELAIVSRFGLRISPAIAPSSAKVTAIWSCESGRHRRPSQSSKPASSPSCSRACSSRVRNCSDDVPHRSRKSPVTISRSTRRSGKRRQPLGALRSAA